MASPVFSFVFSFLLNAFNNGGPCGTRTHNQPLMRRALSPIELTAHNQAEAYDGDYNPYAYYPSISSPI